MKSSSIESILLIAATAQALRMGNDHQHLGAEGPLNLFSTYATNLSSTYETYRPKFMEQVQLWHLALSLSALLLVLAFAVVRRRRRLQTEEDANVKSGLALLWALNQKDVSSRLAYFTKRRSNEVLLSDGQQKITTQQFDELTSKTARQFKSGLVAAGECVIICLPEGMEFYKIVVACLRAGVHFVPLPLNVARDADQATRVIAETKATAIISSHSLNMQLKQGPLGTLRSILVKDIEMVGDAMDVRIRAPRAQDSACTIFSAGSGPTTVCFSQHNIWSMMDSWLQSGMHSKAISACFFEHTEMAAISFFLSTVCSGGQFVVTESEKPSLATIQKLGVTHSLLANELQATFNWTSQAKAVERTLYVTKPTATFADAATANGLKLRSVHMSPMVVGGVSGVTTKITVLKDELAEGNVKTLSMTQRLKAGASIGTTAETMTFVSQGLLQDNVDLLIRSGDVCVEDDVVGEIYLRGSMVAAQCTGAQHKIHAGFTSTGEYGFISSKDLNLYIVAGACESILLEKECIKTVELESDIEKRSTITKATVFPLEGKDGSSKIVIAAELKMEGDDAKSAVANLQRIAKEKKLALGGVAILQPGQVVSRAATKMQFLKGSLKAAPGGLWAPVVAKPVDAAAPAEEEEMNLDDVEAVTFVAKGNKREARQKEILFGLAREFEKIGVVGVDESTTEIQLSSQQMAQGAKRLERMLSTTDAEWTKMGVAGDAAPWGDGICIRQSIEVGSMMFLDSEGDLTKILQQLERQKFPTTKEVGAIVKAEPKLAAAQFEGNPMNVTTYRVLEVFGTFFVCLVAGTAVQCAVWMYHFLQTTRLSGLAFTLGFPTFLNAFSYLTIFFKWLLIGKYKPQALARYSMPFYKWWVMDRLVETWEGWAAVFIMETPWLNGFYKMAGADLDLSANVAATFRDFDLVSIGADADVGGTIITHLVTPQGVIMHKVRIGEAAKTDSKAIIGPNVVMEDGSTLDKCEISVSGSIIKAPAEPRQADIPAARRLQCFQFALNLLGGMVFMGKFMTPTATRLGEQLRMSSVWTSLGANANMEGPYFLDATRWVCYYMIFLWTLGALLLVWTIVAKWIFFGRLKDGHVTSGVWWDLRVYMLNWWYSLSYIFFSQYWLDCTLLAITVYNAFGANVSYKTGLRFLQNMSPHHADFITIKEGANMSNAKCHPSTAADRKVLKNIVLERNTFVGLQSLVQGGVTMAEGSAVATCTRCTSSLAAGQTKIGDKIMEAQKKKDDSQVDFTQMQWYHLAQDLAIALVLRTFVNIGFILGMSAAITVTFYANDFLPIPVVICVAVCSVSFFVGVVYASIMERILHPRKVADLTIGQDMSASTWLQYLQGLYLSQAYTFSFINGSWIAAAFHRLLGADTPLDAQWYSTAIRDQCLLKVGQNSVIDQFAYLVGHVGQPGGVLSFKKASVGDNCTVHPCAIILSGQHMKNNSTLDMWSHSHIEKVIPENKHYSGNPATSAANSRVNMIGAAL